MYWFTSFLINYVPYLVNETEVEQGREEVTKTGNKALPLWLIAPAAVAKV